MGRPRVSRPSPRKGKPTRSRSRDRHILFLTGTRADFGKLKPLIEATSRTPGLKTSIFATGMHMLARYGATVHEIRKAGFRNIFTYINQDGSRATQMDLVLATTVQGIAHYVRENPPDLLVVHGDRIETLAGAIVGALNNILVAHIEGGELSGTIDELIRHAVTKLSHLHFVANRVARNRLLQMGERSESVFTIGSPDVDVMPGIAWSGPWSRERTTGSWRSCLAGWSPRFPRRRSIRTPPARGSALSPRCSERWGRGCRTSSADSP